MVGFVVASVVVVFFPVVINVVTVVVSCASVVVTVDARGIIIVNVIMAITCKYYNEFH